MEAEKFDYYYGAEAEQFSFYRIPRLLIKDERFRGLSNDAKLLYGLMLDRMGMSMKNGWLDEENRAYIHYTVDDIMEDLGCAREKCIKILAELDGKKGIGLIEKKRRGQGKPDIIYVKNFVVAEKESDKPEKYSEGIDDFSEVRKSNFKSFENRTSRNSETEPQEVRKSNPNYTNNNYTDLSYIHPIYPSNQGVRSEPDKSDPDRMDGMDRAEANAYRALIRDNLEYDHHRKYAGEYRDADLFEEIYELICDVVCVRRKNIRINGEDCPYELVKSRFLKLDSGHVEYVMDCMRNSTVRIANIRAYLITALYNAPMTMNHYYQQEVQHDLYASG